MTMRRCRAPASLMVQRGADAVMPEMHCDIGTEQPPLLGWRALVDHEDRHILSREQHWHGFRYGVGLRPLLRPEAV